MGPTDWLLFHVRTDLVTCPSGLPCLVPERVPHATVSVSGVVLYGGQSVKVTCDTGYGVNGTKVTTQTLKCNTDQTLDTPQPCLGGGILIYFWFLISTFIIKIITLICMIILIVVYIYIFVCAAYTLQLYNFHNDPKDLTQKEIHIYVCIYILFFLCEIFRIIVKIIQS